MNLRQYNAFCRSLAHTTHVVQWGGAHVWKVGGRVFAIAGWGEGEFLAVTFKCSQISYGLLKEQKGLRPAPYLASRGMLWIQRYAPGQLDNQGLKAYIRESHHLASLNLSKKLRKELGLTEFTRAPSSARRSKRP